MGLDSYAARAPNGDLTAEDITAFEEADVQLGQGTAGFRGKLYDELIYNVTGVSVYQGWLPPEVVRQMWVALERCDPEEVTKEIEAYKESITPFDVAELRKFFRVCAEHNLGIRGSW
jgi:hypothetical protein